MSYFFCRIPPPKVLSNTCRAKRLKRRLGQLDENEKKKSDIDIDICRDDEGDNCLDISSNTKVSYNDFINNDNYSTDNNSNNNNDDNNNNNNNNNNYN